MPTKWTQAQQAAIEQKNKTLLLSAAAGSGKTSTLTERIIRSITDKQSPADISKMLIVTFTRASASDLKTKIFNALSSALASDPSNRHLTSQLIKLSSARISTIDSFYLSAVRENFSRLGLSSSFRIADESETLLMAKNTMIDTVNFFYDTDESFSALCECFEKIRDTENVMEEVLLDLYTDCIRTPEGVEYLKICAESAYADKDKRFLDTEYGQILSKHIALCFSDHLEGYEQIISKMLYDEKLYRAYGDAFEADRMLCVNVLNMVEGKYENCSYSDIADLLSSYSIHPLKSIGKAVSEYSVFCKTFRDDFKADLCAIRDEYFCYTPTDLHEFFVRTAQNLELLWRVLERFDAEYSAEKKRRNILELTDIKRLALKLFANTDGSRTELAESFSEQFSDIYIDEYQDVDPVQDLIFRCISKPTNRFMVGDIKQSIYSFRGAKPQLFADYRALFPTYGTDKAETGNCETVYMSENFRCSKPVIDFTNLVCADIFKACGNSIGYTDGDDLVYAKKTPEGSTDTNVTVAVFAKNSKKDIADDVDTSTLPTPAEAEASYIASEIFRLITSEYKQDGTPIRPSDIAVLFRNKNTARRISAALSELGIRTSATESVQYFNNPDVMMMLCILNAIDNPQRDIHLAGAMRSPIFAFSLEDLLIINTYGDKSYSLYGKVCLCAEGDGELSVRCSDFIRTLDKWRSISASISIDKLLSYIFSTDIFAASGLVSEKNALGEGGNLRRLYEYARTFEAGSFKGLYNFIEFINTLIENGKTIEAKSENTSEECVTLTTIHKSKGLEFPICFVCNASAPFNTSQGSDTLTFEYGVGAAMTLSDSTGFAFYTSPLKKILDLNGDLHGIEEEMRVLYVALTRAKERLYVTGSYSQAVLPNVISNAHYRQARKSVYSIMCANSYMDWVLPAVIEDSERSCSRLLYFSTDKLPNFSSFDTCVNNVEENADFNQELYEKLTAKFAFKYPYECQGRIPAKLSVSKLFPDILDEADTSVDLFDIEKDPSVPEFFIGKKKSADSSERGTATHLFLQFCDFNMLFEKGVDEVLGMLTANKFVPERTGELIYADELDTLRHSELIVQILSAKKMIREQRFNILLPASQFTLDKDFKAAVEGESIAVQGVIDLIILTEDGKLCLYDYKTDRLTRAELADASLAQKRMNDAHAQQLSYYAKAVDYLFGKEPDRVAVYSTHAARLFDIDVCADTCDTLF